MNNRIVYIVNKKIIVVILLLFSFFSSVSAQEIQEGLTRVSEPKSQEDAPPIRQRLFFGGNFGLQLGSITNINLSPVIGMWVLPRLAVAVGPYYTFYKDFQGKTDIYGGKSYIQYVVFQDLNKFLPLGTNTSLFLHLEDECLSLNSGYWKNIILPPNRFVINTLLGGAGLSQQLGRRGAVNFMVLWPLVESDPEMSSQLYRTPELRIGFTF
jgi:hypothetical protein